MQPRRSLQRLRHSLSCGFLLLLSFSGTFQVYAQDTPSCALDIWIFSSFESCKASDGPVGNGVLYADGQCHSIETSITPDNANYALFPGNYRAQCVDASTIRFFESGCLDSQCTASADGTCDRDDTSPASLYSRLTPPDYAVQDPSNASVGALYTCLKLNNTITSLTFVVFGDCSQCTFAAPPSTPSPVTSPPMAAPVDTWSPTTLLPTPLWSIPNKTDTPVAVGTSAPTGAPVAVPVAVPVAAPVAKPVPTDEAMPEEDSISVALRLSPMYQTMSSSALMLWQNATLAQIRDTADGIVVDALTITHVQQALVDAAAGTRRQLSETNTALHVWFDLAIRYTPSNDDSPSLSDLFHNAFDTEQERSNYLIKLVPNDAIFAPVRLIEVDGAAASPIAAPTPSDKTQTSENGGSSIGLFVALAGGVALIAIAIIGMILYHRRRKHDGSKKEVKTNGETPSDNDDYEEDEYGGRMSASPQQQRWTNEIVVDPSADDVSTLGGSVLLGGGLHLDHTGAGNTGEDEPTASVNLDYDFHRNQYRSDVEDRSRTVATDGTGRFTHFSKLGMNGEGHFNDMDDHSFEQLYADLEEDEEGVSADIASRVRPFEVRAPPGKLGMVVDTPNGGVPVVRAIKPDSVLSGSIRVGDRLISVDHRDVTNMNALEVSSLISLKQHQTRLLIFCRLAPPSSPTSMPSPVATNSTAT